MLYQTHSSPFKLRAYQATKVEKIHSTLVEEGKIFYPFICGEGNAIMIIAIAQRLNLKILVICKNVVVNSWKENFNVTGAPYYGIATCDQSYYPYGEEEQKP